MSRSKKSRKPGGNSNDQLVVVRTRSESELESRLRKTEKRKGLKSGSRHSEGSESCAKRSKSATRVWVAKAGSIDCGRAEEAQ